MKLTLISMRIKGVHYSRFIRIANGVVLTEDEIFELFNIVVPVGTTYTIGD